MFRSASRATAIFVVGAFFASFRGHVNERDHQQDNCRVDTSKYNCITQYPICKSVSYAGVQKYWVVEKKKNENQIRPCRIPSQHINHDCRPNKDTSPSSLADTHFHIILLQSTLLYPHVRRRNAGILHFHQIASLFRRSRLRIRE